MNILNAVRGQPLARKTLALSLLAALCTLHARTALPDTQPGTAPASVSEAAPDLTPLTSATSVPAPSDDGAGTLGASALQPGVSSILARLSPAIIYVPPVVTDPVDLAILDARKAMQANNLAAFDTAAALVPRGMPCPATSTTGAFASVWPPATPPMPSTWPSAPTPAPT